jgi:hypothetical protein
LTEYISTALRIGGSVELSVLKIETSYFLAIIKADWLYTVVAYKYCGTTGP